MTPDDDEKLAPSEMRLVELMAVLSIDGQEPGAGDSLERRIMRAARIQTMLRTVTPVIDDVISGIADAVMLLAGAPPRGRSRG